MAAKGLLQGPTGSLFRAWSRSSTWRRWKSAPCCRTNLSISATCPCTASATSVASTSEQPSVVGAGAPIATALFAVATRRRSAASSRRFAPTSGMSFDTTFSACTAPRDARSSTSRPAAPPEVERPFALFAAGSAAASTEEPGVPMRTAWGFRTEGGLAKDCLGENGFWGRCSVDALEPLSSLSPGGTLGSTTSSSSAPHSGTTQSPRWKVNGGPTSPAKARRATPG
mmetsp:Transcript_80547/g.232808  ORF Transcript_80547/g.232808 Transcript_80547/m.232808 type:complete len:227 (+) Transcript_80547:759-1439(+)